MSFWISFLNDFAVSIFGSVLSASFCDALANRRNRRIFVCCMILIPLLQFWVYTLWNVAFLRQIYPLIVHLPLMLVLYLLTGKLLWPAISVLTAYLCCQLRRWIALLTVAILGGGDVMHKTVELAVTLPLLFLLLRFAAPAVRQLSDKSVRTKLQFGVIPAFIPVSDEPGHGIGVQSICAIVQRHGGVCSFQVQNGQFILRLSL